MAIDWTASMQQTFKYYEVDPASWRNRRELTNILSSQVTWDNDLETLGSATIDSTDEYDEIYIRIYLVAEQPNAKEEHCLGTFLVQTPKDKFDGKVHTYSYDAYTPLLELKDSIPPLGYFVPKNQNIMGYVSRACWDNIRVPVISTSANDTLFDNFVAETSDNWLTFLTDLVAKAKFKIGLDETSQIIFYPDQEADTLQPMYVFTDDNSSLLQPEIDRERDLYGIPNVVEVVYTANDDTCIYKRVENNDPNSPISTVSRGREVVHRETSPSLSGLPSEHEVEAYAKKLLKEMSVSEHKLTYTHGFIPHLRPGNCVMLNYRSANLEYVKAKIVRQRISCESGCQVEETAVYTTSLWGA